VISRNEVTAQRYVEDQKTGIRAEGDGVICLGNPEAKKAQVIRSYRCTTCGRSGHNAANPDFHPPRVRS
jgi:hypothetical protein